MQNARKGDLILIGTVHRSYVIGQGSEESLDYTYGVVASATRGGEVKTYYAVGFGDDQLSPYAQPVPPSARVECRVYVMSAAEIDVMAVVRAAKAHHWPDHPGQPRGFDTLSEARAVARPFLTADFMAKAAA